MKESNVQLGFGFRQEKGWKDIDDSNYNTSLRGQYQLEISPIIKRSNASSIGGRWKQWRFSCRKDNIFAKWMHS